MSDQHHEVTVRRAQLPDLEGLVASSGALFAEDAGTRDPSININWPLEAGPERFAAGIDDPSRLTLVAESGGQIVAHLTGAVAEATARQPVKVATLMSLYVRPAHRSGGLGVRLVEHFSAWAKEAGAELAEVTAYASNSQAIRFYERSGFTSQAVTLRTNL
ncbi:GNAT family N-acetyltransferase [Streptomyces sp. NPDC050738]|uniref:GNAT family N-acetyltransferase n=1 Tax=Streptomyces sp. NPDC050738 TaxID=3154744 RepID=UPI0034379E89